MLESLHDRRVFVTSLFQRSTNDVKNRLGTSSLRKEIDQLECLVREKMRQLTHFHNDLGSCVSSVEGLLRTTMELQTEASDISERCLVCVKASQSTETSALAYSVLENATIYQQKLEQRYFLSC